MAFTRRFTSFPPNEVLNAIEAINIVDIAPPVVLAAGAARVLLVAEMDDGPFAGENPFGFPAGDSEFHQNSGARYLQVFGGQDLVDKYGGFGFMYNGVPHNNPSARTSGGELWNGNGFLKLRNLRFAELVIARVDTSVGSVSFTPLAGVSGAQRGPFVLEAGDTLTADVDGVGSSVIGTVTATAAVVTGGAFGMPLSSDTITVQVDGGAVIPVAIPVDTVTVVAAAINAAVDFDLATTRGGDLLLTTETVGTSAQVVLGEFVGGALGRIGLTAGTTDGTGNVASVAEVTIAELVAIVGAIGGILGTITNDGLMRISSDTASTGSIQITGGDINDRVGFPTTLNMAGVHPGGQIAAGTRVRDASGDEWVTMQTLTIPEGVSATDTSVGPWPVKVRPGLDDGSLPGATAGDVNVVVDQPLFSDLSVTNPFVLLAAATGVQIDNAYTTALAATLALKDEVRRASFLLIARQSTAVLAAGRQNAIDASNNGLFGRKYVYGVPLGQTQAQAQALLTANLRSDRLYATWPYWRTTVPEIRTRGVAGGTGFTDDGVITVRSDGPLASIMSQLPPEEDPGQASRLIDAFTDVDSGSEDLTIQSYTALRAAGIAAPRVDFDDGSLYQSGVTTDLDPARTEINRRNLADFLQDNYARISGKYSKRLSSQANRDALVAEIEAFLLSLLSENAPAQARIDSFSIDPESGNTPERLAAGQFVIIERVRQFASLRAIVHQSISGTTTVVSEL